MTTPEERARLLKLGKPLGTAITNLISIVTVGTFRRWVRTEEGHKPTKAKPGRPRIDTDLSELIAKIAKETGFGYTRILGELRKLGIKKVCRQTVKNVLKEHGIDTGPGRSETTWDHFLSRHAKTLWQPTSSQSGPGRCGDLSTATRWSSCTSRRDGCSSHQ